MGATRRRTRISANFDSWSPLHWVAATLLVLLSGIHLYLGIISGSAPFLVVTGLFLVFTLLFFTKYWESILYVVTVVYAFALGVMWALSGMAFFELGIVTGVVSVSYAVVGLYLFVNDRSRQSRYGE